MESTAYDPAALDELIGITPSSVGGIGSGIRLNPDDQGKLSELAKTPAPGVTLPAQPAAPGAGVPDYLKPFIPKAPETPPAAPVATDWGKEMQTLTGKASEGEVTQETFEREMVRREATINFINQNQHVEGYFNLVNDKVDPIKAVTDSVTAAYHRAGIKSPTVINGELSELITDGELTSAGTERYDDLKRQASTELDKIRGEAATYAEDRAKSLDDYYEQFPKLAKDFTFLGVPFEEGEMQQIQADIRSGASDDWWSNSATPYEAAMKDHWKAFIKNQVMFFDKAQQVDKRSQNYGRMTALGSKF